MGQGVEIEDGCIVNTNPATGEILSRVKCTVPEEVDLLVERANEAQKFWLRTPYTERIALLKTGIEIIHTKSDTLTKWMIQEMGKPLTEAKEEMEDAIDKEKFMELLATSLKPQRFGTSTIVRDPFGVVAILSPWNFPVGTLFPYSLAKCCFRTLSLTFCFVSYTYIDFFPHPDEILLLALPALASGNTGTFRKLIELVHNSASILIFLK
jgi:acyl-CoA reductase-like NAD-dependent aldehyde dehydrogenase